MTATAQITSINKRSETIAKALSLGLEIIITKQTYKYLTKKDSFSDPLLGILRPSEPGIFYKIKHIIEEEERETWARFSYDLTNIEQLAEKMTEEEYSLLCLKLAANSRN